MKFTPKRLLGAGVIAVAAIVAPISLTVGLPAIGSGVGSVALAANAGPCPALATNDVICYSQSTGSSGTFAAYTPATTNGKGTATSVGLTSGGGCATPTWQGTPLVNLSGFVYTDSTYKTLAAGNPFPVDAAKQKTGVCGINGTGANPWSIDDTAAGAEALDFSIGSNPNMGSSRLFSEAQIVLNNNGNIQTTVTLVESLTGTGTVGTQTCTLPSSTTTVDTSGNAACTQGPSGAPAAFDTVEIRVPTVGGSVSVVGPSSIFALAHVLCAGDNPITPTGAPAGVTAPLSVTSGCKTWTSYTYGIDQATGDQQLAFNAFSANPVPFTIKVAWAPYEPPCQPTASPDPSPGAPVYNACMPSEFSLNGMNFFDDIFCPPPTAAVQQTQPMCVTNWDYKIVTDPATNQPESFVSEQLNVLADFFYRAG
jgi:hypothetical protein